MWDGHGQRKRGIIETKPQQKGTARGIKYHRDTKIRNISSAFFSQNLLGNFRESSFGGVEEAVS